MTLFFLGMVAGVACYELGLWLADRRVTRLPSPPMRPSALPPIYFDEGPTLIQQMRRVVEREL